MEPRRACVIVATVLTVGVALPTTARTYDNEEQEAVQDAVVQFGARHPQPAPANLSHFLDPNDVAIQKGGTVTFVVNGAGHGIAIYPVSKDTTRQDIEPDLCQGGATVCNGTTGTQNLRYQVTDDHGNLIIDTGTNPPWPRVDDATDRLLATSGTIPGQPITAGAFLVGSTAEGAAGNRIQYRFTKTGRFLVICMNRGHSLNDWMFGFVSVE